MKWLRLRGRGITTVAALFGALILAWNAAVTMRLSSAMPGRGLDEAALLPLNSREVDQDSIIILNKNETPRLVDVQPEQNLNATHRSARTDAFWTSGHFPRTFNMVDAGSDPHFSFTEKKRQIYIDRPTLRTWKHIDDDTNYPIVEESRECEPMSSWQSDSHPNCNSMHELDLYAHARSQNFYYVASGGYNDVFRVHFGGRNSSSELYPDLALKVLSPGKKHRAQIPSRGLYSHDNYDVVRRDALVLERLTNSSHVLPLYAYCGFALSVPYADSGTLANVLPSEWRGVGRGWNNASSSVKLKYATDAARGLADIHDIGVVHADLTIKQYLIRDGTLQLGDFNRGIFLKRNVTAPHEACTFQMTRNYGTTRAPEEYMHKPQTKAVDVWSLGSILYHILTGSKVWKNHKKNQAQSAVINGLLPTIDKSILNSADPIDKVLKMALDMCYVYEPSERKSAREVASFLHKAQNLISSDSNR